MSWLATLKPGDLVIAKVLNGYHSTTRTEAVKCVTVRTVTLKDGRQVRDNSRKDAAYPITPEWTAYEDRRLRLLRLSSRLRELERAMGNMYRAEPHEDLPDDVLLGLEAALAPLFVETR